ncbi:MAG: adenylate kinase [Ornithinimicrobium sp.]
MSTTDPTPRRILVYGVTGSGKSHAARRIAELRGLPLVLADEVAWQPGWQQLEPERQREVFAALAAGDRWVFDTAYGIWLDVVLPRVDLIVALDYPRWFSLQRLLRRTGRRIVTREPICNGNAESLRMAFSRDSIIAWHFRSFPRKRRRIRTWAQDPASPPMRRFRRARHLNRWLDDHP